MNFNVEFLRKFIEKHFDGNLTKFAKAIDANSSTVSRICRYDAKAGLSFVGKVIEYCAENGLDYSNFLQMPLLKSNSKKSEKII